MKLSIIVPVFRVADTLRRCVESIRRQGLTNYELILVDDCSDDGSGEICNEMAEEDRHIIVVHREKNGGLSATRNSGIDIAQGSYITFVDSDDYLAPETYRPLMAILASHPEYDILEYPVLFYDGSKNAPRLSLVDCTYTDMQHYWLKGMAYTHSYACNKIYRRDLFNGVRYPVGKVFEDMHTLPSLLRNATTVATTATGLYHYCYNPKGITATAQGRELTDLLEAHLAVLQSHTLDSYCHSRDYAHYYAHVLNIQFDVYSLTGREPLLPSLCVVPVTWKLTLCNLLGVRNLCKLNKLAHKITELCR